MRLLKLIPIITMLMIARSTFAVKIADISRLGGERQNVITGIGLVIGLKGTGDGEANLPAAQALVHEMSEYIGPESVIDVGTGANVAIVNVAASLPGSGTRAGDHLDAVVMSKGAATSLKGGMLFMSALHGPNGQLFPVHSAAGTTLIPYALANGQVEISDSINPTTGKIRGGAVMEVDLPARYIDGHGQFTIILDPEVATWSTANSLARLINESIDTGEQAAVVIDPRSIIVKIPPSELAGIDSFISKILNLPVPSSCVERPRPPATVDITTTGTNAKVAPQLAAASSVGMPATPQKKYWNLGLWWVGGCLLMNGFTRLYSVRKQPATVNN